MDLRDKALMSEDTNFVVYLDDDSEIDLPTKWVVCDLCDGEGKHVNPSIDGGGINVNDRSPEFWGRYMGGEFDVSCYKCNGRSTAKDIDEDACDPEHLDAWYRQQEEEHNSFLEHQAELRAGA
jgi:hypothetical protein